MLGETPWGTLVCSGSNQRTRGGLETSEKVLGCPLFPLLSILLVSPPLSCCVSGSPLMAQGTGGVTDGAMQQMWQLTQHQPLPCLNGCHSDQEAHTVRFGLSVFHTRGTKGGKADWDRRCWLQWNRRPREHNTIKHDGEMCFQLLKGGSKIG